MFEIPGFFQIIHIGKTTGTVVSLRDMRGIRLIGVRGTEGFVYDRAVAQL